MDKDNQDAHCFLLITKLLLRAQEFWADVDSVTLGVGMVKINRSNLLTKIYPPKNNQPEGLVKVKDSYTAKYLKDKL